MKFRTIVFLLLSIQFIQCSSFSKKGSTFFTNKEKEILKASTAAMGYDYSYDAEIDLDYIFSNPYSSAGIKNKNLQLEKSLKKFDRSSVIIFYEKVYMLKVKTLSLISTYKEDEEWKEYTHIKKYLYPVLEKYFESLEKVVLKINPKYRSKIKNKKIELETDMLRIMS